MNPPLLHSRRGGATLGPMEKQTCFQLWAYHTTVIILHQPPPEQSHKTITGITVCLCVCGACAFYTQKSVWKAVCWCSFLTTTSWVSSTGANLILCSREWDASPVFFLPSASLDISVNSCAVVAFLFWWLSQHQGSHLMLRLGFTVVWLRSGWNDGLIWSPIKESGLT